MKKTYIFGIILLAALVVVMVLPNINSRTCLNFREAGECRDEVSVSGSLVKTQPLNYNSEIDQSSFSFFMKDKDGVEQRVICNHAMPAGFEKSDQLVVNGSMKGNDFVATDVLIKCVCSYDITPSKYKAAPPAAVIFSISEQKITEWNQ